MPPSIFIYIEFAVGNHKSIFNLGQTVFGCRAYSTLLLVIHVIAFPLTSNAISIYTITHTILYKSIPILKILKGTHETFKILQNVFHFPFNLLISK